MTDESSIAGLQQLYQNNQAARLMLDLFAGYQRNRSTTKVDHLLWKLRALEGNTDVARGDVVAVFKELESMGYGRYVPGRWTYPSRFQWKASLVEVGKAASGEKQTVQSLPDSNLTLQNDAAEDEDDEPDFISHTFQLRPDLPVTLELPANLTRSEATRLAKFVESLPFEG